MSDMARVCVPVADLNRRPGQQRDRQLLLGMRVRIERTEGAHSEVTSERDGYRGYVDARALCPDHPITHRISAPASHAYHAPEMKSGDRVALHHASLLNVTETANGFGKTAYGWVPLLHLKDAQTPETDLIDVAKLYLGTPYLWGGNSRAGIDCSGLVQAALSACAIPCPGDSGDQEKALGRALPAKTPVQKGDLLFWAGHVALAADAQTLIHANAFHMAVQYEPLSQALARIKAVDGPVTAHKRL